MQNVEWVMEWVIPLRLLRLLEHLAVLINRLFSDKLSYPHLTPKMPQNTKDVIEIQMLFAKAKV